MFSGGVTVAQRFLVPLVGVRISTGEFSQISSEVERRFCKPYVTGAVPVSGLKPTFSSRVGFFVVQVKHGQN